MQVDVLIINALDDELQAVLELGEGTSSWERSSDNTMFPYYVRTFPLPSGNDLCVAAAWSGAMGETPAANRAQTLIEYLDPLALAMCGICAGRKGEVFLGDVIVADRVFSYDQGKIRVSMESGRRVEEILHDIETHNLERAWAIQVKDFARDWCESWLKNNERPVSLESQHRWILHCQYAHEQEKKEALGSHPDRKVHCPDYERALASLLKRELVVLKGGTLALTESGRELVLNERQLHEDGLPSDKRFQVHMGPIATGKTVRQDADLFDRLAHLSRKVLGLDMEAAAIGWIAENSRIPWIVTKAVSDYGDSDKDDGFRQFAARASAQFLLAF